MPATIAARDGASQGDAATFKISVQRSKHPIEFLGVGRQQRDRASCDGGLGATSELEGSADRLVSRPAALPEYGEDGIRLGGAANFRERLGNRATDPLVTIVREHEDDVGPGWRCDANQH